MSEARQALRKILRAVDQHLTSVNGNKQWRNHVIKEFRSAANTNNPAAQKEKLQEAKDYAYLVNSVQEYRVSLAALQHVIAIPAVSKGLPHPNAGSVAVI